ncbi:MAG: minichromosome maintenance protein MCM [Candidatus Anstonellales archaeon]
MAEYEETVVEEFRQFFSSVMEKEISNLALVYPSVRSLVVSYPLLEKFNADLADALILKPDEVIEAAEEGIRQMGVGMPGIDFKPHVRFCDLPDKNLLVQDISSKHIERLIAVKGVVTKRTEVMHKVQIAVYRCRNCNKEEKIPMLKKAAPPQKCKGCGGKELLFQEEESYFVDIQKAEMQDLLERIRGGAPAARIMLFLEDDYVNSITPGDNIEVTGIMRIMPLIPNRGRGGGPKVQTYSRYLDVMHIKKMQKEFEELEINEEDIKKIKELAADPRIYTRMVKSLAPSIYGHEEVKEGILLQLFGGTRDKKLEGTGGVVRDDMHILLIGDPGAAKTRFLLNVTALAPKSIYVSGKTATGVGLTASAERDEMGEGGWTLKAGALVIASGGIGAIDEFDKIEESERAIMHEVMESQTISIAKAGIVAKFRAKTAILAAANPKMGRFDPGKPPGEQFDIPTTLLSRFDLIFPIIDIMDEEKDTKLAQHILKIHRKAAERSALEEGDEKEREGEFKEEVSDPDQISQELLRKYISYARKEIRPVLTPEAENRLQDYYVQLRSQAKRSGGGVPITPRQIEGLIRMSEASAKIRLSEKVELQDAERAIRLMDWILHKVYTDRETGRIDIDIVTTGIPKSKRDKIETIIGIIRELQREYDSVEIAKVVERAKEYKDIDEVFVRRTIEELIDRGELYRREPGFVRLVNP